MDDKKGSAEGLLPNNQFKDFSVPLASCALMNLNAGPSSALVCFLLKGRSTSFCWSENFLNVQ